MSISNNFSQIKPAVFLDRDGTINMEKDYLYKIEELELIPGTKEAIHLLNQAGFLVIVVTNQSGIARGFYCEDDLKQLHQYLDGLLLSAGARVAGWYYCPHHTAGKSPYNIICECRKPLPGMLLQAAREHSIDLSASWMVGDKLADIEAGLAAGCQPILVRTGYGSQEEPLLPEGVKVADNLLEAAGLIIMENQIASG